MKEKQKIDVAVFRFSIIHDFANGIMLDYGEKVDSNFQLKVSTLLTFINNLRWYALPVSLVTSIVMNIIFSQFTTVTIILLFIFICVFYVRHILNYIAYRQLNKLSNASNIVPLWKWISLYFITYSIICLFWAIPPLHYYFKKIFGFDVFITTTLKDIEDVAILVKNMAATSQFVAIGIGTPIAERPSHTTGHTDHVSGDSAGQNRHK